MVAGQKETGREVRKWRPDRRKRPEGQKVMAGQKDTGREVRKR